MQSIIDSIHFNRQLRQALIQRPLSAKERQSRNNFNKAIKGLKSL